MGGGLLQTLGVFPGDGPGRLSTADWLISVKDGVFDEADDSEVPKTALLSHDSVSSGIPQLTPRTRRCFHLKKRACELCHEHTPGVRPPGLEMSHPV